MGNLYTQKCPAAVFPFNGYGKSIGMMYVEEMGICENPILITNTLSVGAALESGIDWVLKHNLGVGISDSNTVIFGVGSCAKGCFFKKKIIRR